MQENNTVVKTTTSGGLSCGFILFVVFLVLKLCGVIDWSWFWIFFPLWIGPACMIPIIIILAIIVVAIEARR